MVTQVEIDALKSAIARGVLKVKRGDEEVQYSSVAEMIRALRFAQAELAAVAGRTPHIGVSYVKTNRGL